MAALTSTILAGLAIGAAGASAVGSLKNQQTEAPPAPPPLPPPPERDLLGEAQAVTRARRRRMGSSRAGSIYSGPSGVDTPAPTERKTLLGG